jgi:hypothetical protein
MKKITREVRKRLKDPKGTIDFSSIGQALLIDSKSEPDEYNENYEEFGVLLSEFWEPHPTLKDTIIMDDGHGKKFKLVAPPHLRDLLIELQNELSFEFLEKKGYFKC